MNFRVRNTTKDMAARLAEIQRACFPTLSEKQLITEQHFSAHVDLFPEGQHAVLTDDGLVVASSTDIRYNINFNHIEHRYMDVSGNNWLKSHDPNGEWLYGIDIGVHPDWRGHRLSSLLYTARKNLAQELGLRGHVAGGMLKGYHAHKDKLSVEAYVDKVVAGELFDPVLSVQLRQGFSVAGIIQDYLDDPSCDNKAALIVWHNPEFRE